MKLVFNPEATCIMKPLFLGSQLMEFSCGKGAFVEGTAMVKYCPFCERPVNSLVPLEFPEDPEVV